MPSSSSSPSVAGSPATPSGKKKGKKSGQKDTKPEEDLNKIMAECSSTAQALKKNITEKLESLNGQNAECNQDVESLDDTNSHIKEILEKSIKEKLSELEEALKQESQAGILEAEESSPTESSLLTPTDSVAAPINPSDVVPPLVEKELKTEALVKERCESPPTKKNEVPAKKSSGKDRMTVERILKSLNSQLSDEAKLQELAAKYVEVYENHRALDSKSKQQEKVVIQAVREKDQLQSEHNRLVLAKSRLENLCRELQRQNKVVKEESLSRLKEEEAKRRDIATRFQGTLNEILQLVSTNQETNVMLRKENSELASKLKLLMDHYEIWEQNVHKIIERKELEVQLAAAKLAQSHLLFNQEKEKLLTDKQELYLRLSEMQKKGIQMSQTESHLKEELAIYTSKYQEFQDVLTKSNDTFTTFKKDMEKMSKQIKKLEKETLQWKAKFESCSNTLATVSKDKQDLEEQLSKSNAKIQTLEKLCRALQKDRGQGDSSSEVSKEKTSE